MKYLSHIIVLTVLALCCITAAGNPNDSTTRASQTGQQAPAQATSSATQNLDQAKQKIRSLVNKAFSRAYAEQDSLRRESQINDLSKAMRCDTILSKFNAQDQKKLQQYLSTQIDSMIKQQGDSTNDKTPSNRGGQQRTDKHGHSNGLSARVSVIALIIAVLSLIVTVLLNLPYIRYKLFGNPRELKPDDVLNLLRNADTGFWSKLSELVKQKCTEGALISSREAKVISDNLELYKKANDNRIGRLEKAIEERSEQDRGNAQTFAQQQTMHESPKSSDEKKATPMSVDRSTQDGSQRFYADTFTSQGFLRNSLLKDQTAASIAAITKDSNGTWSYTIISNEKVIGNYSATALRMSDPDNDVSTLTRIETIKPGKLKVDGQYLRIVEKAKIHLA